MKRDSIAEHNRRLKEQLAADADHDEYEEEPDPEHARAMEGAKWTLVKILAVLVALVFLWGLIPWNPYNRPPRAVNLTDLHEVQKPEGIFLEGTLRNNTGSRIHKVVFMVRYPLRERTETEYLIFDGVQKDEIRPFSKRMVFLSEVPKDRRVIPLDMKENP